ncbi:uncharacterized protein LOC121738881 isoform X3 [Aricia agestis]|nr:uncharacterized protein LOC121738881 isoform X3 [Aricia agestis]
MHSNESAPVAAAASGPALLGQLGRLIVRARSTSPAHAQRRRHKIIADPDTTQQIQQCQPKPAAEPSPRVVAQLDSHVHALWSDHIPLCIEISLGPDCASCYAGLCAEAEAGYDKPHAHAPRPLLLERWTMRVTPNKSEESGPAITAHWLLNAVRSQLHFSQLSAWRATIHSSSEDKPAERRRKLSRETCNYKKVEANCDESDLEERKLNLIYSIRLPGESHEGAEFARPPAEHRFPVTELGGARLAVRLESLPRLPSVPRVRCACRPRRPSLPPPPAAPPAPLAPDDLAAQLGTLALGPRPPPPGPVDDRMLTPCSASGKHRCSCDDESDATRSPPAAAPPPPEPDERRLREIAKYKRRLRKESKLRRLCDSTSSEGDGARREAPTSIPILQAARFDRLRALGCLRRYAPPAPAALRTRTVATQTDGPACACGAAPDPPAPENGARRKRGEDDGPPPRNCDSSQCDSNLDNASFKSDIILRRPKVRRHFPPAARIERVISDRLAQTADMRDLNLRDDDSVFSAPRPEPKRQKTYSVGDDYVCYEKCDYGTVDELAGGAGGAGGADGVAGGGGAGGGEVPSPTEVDRFRWRFDSAASMVFHHKTGLPLTSSPAPLRRGSTCFDFDDSINGVSGIKSALYHGPAPASPPPAAAPPRAPRPRHGPSSGLLGSFEESALKGRLEPVATVAGFTAELGASGAFCPPHRRLPVTVFFYAPGGTNAPYMGHINLGSEGYRVARSGTIQVSLFNPHGTLVKMFVVLYDLTAMPPHARTFLRQRTLYMPAGAPPPAPAGTRDCNKWLRYLIHLRFMTSRSGKLYLHTDIRIIVSRKADLDTATAHSALFRPIAPPHSPTDELSDGDDKLTNGDAKLTNGDAKLTNGDSKLKGRDKLSNGSSDLANGSAEKFTNGRIEKLIDGREDKLTNGSVEKPTNGSSTLTNGSAALTNGSAGPHGVVTRAPNRVFGGCGDLEAGGGAEGVAGAGVPYELRSFTYAPDNPRFSPR